MLLSPAVAVGTAGVGADVTVTDPLPALTVQGTTTGAAVLTLNVDDTVPTVKVVDTVVFALLEEVILTLTVWLFKTVPLVDTKAELPIEYDPPLLIEIGVATLIPVMVTELDVVTVDVFTLFAAVNVIALGVVSPLSVVNDKKSLTILISKFAFAP